MSNKVTTDEKIVRFKIGILVGLIAISFIILQNLLSLNNLKVPSFIALIAFSISIPMLGGVLFIYQIWIRRTQYFDSSLIYFIDFGCTIIGCFFTIVGVAAAFWNVSWISGVVFIVIAIFMFIIIYLADEPNVPRNETK